MTYWKYIFKEICELKLCVYWLKPFDKEYISKDWNDFKMTDYTALN